MGKSEHDLADSYFNGSDLAAREDAILVELEDQIGFHPTKLLGKSTWWGSEEIGAFQYLGKYEGIQAVLKVQGVKPDVSEADMLRSFAQTNQSKLVRPPELYTSVPWDDAKRYEALVVEYITGPKVISVPATALEIDKFFRAYAEYREKCLRTPWLPKPTTPLPKRMSKAFSAWEKVAQKQFPDKPFRIPEDDALIEKAQKSLLAYAEKADVEFQHTHISADDMFDQDGHIIITSNLLWGWQIRFFDAVLGYHWQQYRLGNTYDQVTPELIENQKALWLDAIWQIPQNDEERRQLSYALLERQLAGLIIDSLTVKPDKPIAEYLVQSTREEVRELLKIV